MKLLKKLLSVMLVLGMCIFGLANEAVANPGPSCIVRPGAPCTLPLPQPTWEFYGNLENYSSLDCAVYIDENDCSPKWVEMAPSETFLQRYLCDQPTTSVTFNADRLGCEIGVTVRL